MAEAECRDEEEWNERLENESVQSLSRSFYESFARGHYNGADGKEVHNDEFCCSPSVGSLTIGGYSSTTEHARPHPPFDDSSSTTRKESTRRGIFDLTRAFRDLRACSSSRTVLPVRLGRALSPSSEATPPAVLKTPIPPSHSVLGSTRARARRRRLRQSTTGKTMASVPTKAPTIDGGAPSEAPVSGGAIPGELKLLQRKVGEDGGEFWHVLSCCPREGHVHG